MSMISWSGVLITLFFIAFPVYMICRLESISRRLSRMEHRFHEQERKERLAENLRIVQDSEPRSYVRESK
ncbi:hypothetical protein LJK87_47355 [Paenibacillus sp. P25]|nr:hypothetical protein LJK87_47355 [Paenibacillus sp. P25]